MIVKQSWGCLIMPMRLVEAMRKFVCGILMLVYVHVCMYASMCMLIIGIGGASRKFCALKINLAIAFTRKTGWNALVRL